MKTTNTIYHSATVTRDRRNQLNDHKSAVIWFTGLSGVGKTTIAKILNNELLKLNFKVKIIDGDTFRKKNKSQMLGRLPPNLANVFAKNIVKEFILSFILLRVQQLN